MHRFAQMEIERERERERGGEIISQKYDGKSVTEKGYRKSITKGKIEGFTIQI